MTSEPTEAFVWIWLPEAEDPVVAGRVEDVGGQLVFNYGRTYLERDDAIALFLPDLPLIRGRQEPGEYQAIPGPIADAMPDHWGRRVILRNHFGDNAVARDVDDLNPISYLLGGGRNRIGALAFSPSSEELADDHSGASLEDLSDAASAVANNEKIDPELAAALAYDSGNVGGAWPKALVDDDDHPKLAKFAPRPQMEATLKYEFVAMKMAGLAGLDTADVELVQIRDTPVLLVRRFDRIEQRRRMIISCLTTQRYGEHNSRYCTYWEFAHILRRRSKSGTKDVTELFKRIMFNVLVSNTDDHPKNHAVFWDGESLELTPAYDVTPQPRDGGEQVQAMAYGEDGERRSNVHMLVERASTYALTRDDAHQIKDDMVTLIKDNFKELADKAEMTGIEAEAAWDRQFLNDYSMTPQLE